MKKTFTVAAIMLVFHLIFTARLHASLTRTRTMGGVNMVVQDDANFWLFPASIISSQQQVMFDPGGTRETIFEAQNDYAYHRWVGAIIRTRQNTSNTLGLFWSDKSDPNAFLLFGPVPMPAYQNLDLVYGALKPWGASGFHFGFSLGREASDNGYVGNTVQALYQLRFGLGFARTHSDMNFGYRFAHYGTTDNSISGHVFQFRYRRRNHSSARLQLIPFVDVQFGLERKTPRINGHFWKLWTGLGYHYRPTDRTLLILGLSVLHDYQSKKLGDGESQRSNYSFKVPFVFGGLETRLWPWLWLRLGFQKMTSFDVYHNDFLGSSYGGSRVEFPFVNTAGLGIRFDSFTMDLSWNIDFFHRGPYFMTGKSESLFNLITFSLVF